MAEEPESTAPQDVSAQNLPVNELPDNDSPATAPPVAGSRETPARQPKTGGRPFRVKLRGSVLVLVQLPNRRSVRAALHQLSTTGGVMHLEKPLDEKIKVELIFHIRETTLRQKAEMLFPMWATQGWMQPFRFIELSEANSALLDSTLKSFLGEMSKSAASGS
jgi:hypothetical protein